MKKLKKYKAVKKPLATVRLVLKGENNFIFIKFFDAIKQLHESKGYRYRGPVSLPNRYLKYKVRKSPDGSGKASFQRYQEVIKTKIFKIYQPDCLELLLEYLKKYKALSQFSQVVMF